MNPRDEIITLFNTLPHGERAPLLAALLLDQHPPSSGHLTVEDIAADLKCSKHTAYGLLRSGRIKANRLNGGRLWRVRRQDFEEYQAQAVRGFGGSRARGPRRLAA